MAAIIVCVGDVLVVVFVMVKFLFHPLMRTEKIGAGNSSSISGVLALRRCIVIDILLDVRIVEGVFFVTGGFNLGVYRAFLVALCSLLIDEGVWAVLL